MPRLLRQKVLTLPLPNLLPVLPFQFTEQAQRKSKRGLKRPESSSRVNGGRGSGHSHGPNSTNGGASGQDGIDQDMNMSEDGLSDDQDTVEGGETTLEEPDEASVLQFLNSQIPQATASGSGSRPDDHEVASGDSKATNGVAAVNGRGSLNHVKAREGEWEEPEVFFIKQTGEVFLDYEEYANRLAFYRRRIFTSDNNMHNSSETITTFFSALEGEKLNSAAAQSAFPPVLKSACLRAAQFSREGRLENLSDKTYMRLKDRFFESEKLFVTVGKNTYIANVAEVIPPASTSSTKTIAHALALDSSVTMEEANRLDDPMSYRYKVQLITASDVSKNTQVSSTVDSVDRWSDQYVLEVPAEVIARDKQEFSKLAIKRLFKDSLSRESAICSPWLVQEQLAKRYNVPTDIPEHVQREANAEREIQIEKRRRQPANPPPEPESEEPAKKKQKTLKKGKKSVSGAAEEEAALLKEKEAQAEEEAAKKKKPTKFPAEDYLIELTARDKSAGKAEKRPSFSQGLPFPAHFETFMWTWSFLNAFGKALALSPFTIDEYENALYHSNPSQPCVLLQEIHTSLLQVIRNDAQSSHQDLVLPLKAMGQPLSDADSSSGDEEEEDEDEDQQEKIKLVSQQAGIHAAAFSDKEASVRSARKDWEAMLVGCLWQRGTTHSVPNLIRYLQGILLEAENAPTGRPTWSAASMRPRLARNLATRYLALHSVFKLEIVAFLVELAMQTRVLKAFYDQSVLALSKCRNDQMATKRELAKLRGEKPDADGEGKPQDDTEGTPSVAPVEPEATLASDDDLSDLESEEGSQRGGGGGGGGRSKTSGAALRQKAVQAKQAQRDAEAAARDAQFAKDKADAKAKRAEKEEERRLVERTAELAREFRRQYNTLRVYPLGQDRFLNTVWWLDGCGAADLAESEAAYGTGRLYIQGAKQIDIDLLMEDEDLNKDEMEAKRAAEEPEGERLDSGEWAMIDSIQQFEAYMSWLSEKGKREAKLLKAINNLRPYIEQGLRKREEMFAPEPEVEEQGLTARRQKRHPGKSTYRSQEAYLGYRNTYR